MFWLTLLLEGLGPKESGLECIRIENAELLEEDYSRSGILVFLQRHLAVVWVEDWTEVMCMLRHRPNDLVREPRTHLIPENLTSILKDVKIPTVTMHVTRKDNPTGLRVILLSKLVAKSYQGLRVVDGRVQVAARVLPSSVEVHAQ